MSDNELDNLFKEAAEGFTPPQDESAWKQMTTMLDQNPVKPASLWNRKVISAITVSGIIGITAIWFAATGDQTEISKTNEKNGANNATQGVVQEQKEQTHQAGNENLTSAQPMEDKNITPYAVSSPVRRHGNNPIQREQSSAYEKERLNLPNEHPVEREERSESVPPIIRESAESIRSAQSYSLSSIKEENPLLKGDSVKPVVQQIVVRDSIRITDKNEKKSSTRGSISIKVAVSPDFSSVNYFTAGQTGINYGLLVGYSFNNRWSVYTGVLSSKKLYDTEDVEGSYNSNGHDYPVKELNGDCRILDIPINVYYTFFPERSLSFRTGVGISSYIMRKETYVYCVDNYGSDIYYQQHVNGKNNEWFKVLNLSVAVSKRISSRWSAEVEPFIKAPLAGVGEGKVSLVSMGAFINLKFDFILDK